MKHGLLPVTLAAALVGAAAGPALAQQGAKAPDAIPPSAKPNTAAPAAATPAAASATLAAATPTAATPAAAAPAGAGTGADTGANSGAGAAAAPAVAPATPEQQAAAAGARPAQVGTALPPAPTAVGSLLQTILSLGFVIALLVGLAWLLKRFGPKNVTGGTTVKLVGALSVGARERILVVEVGEQWIVVGASPGRMNALATMPRQETAELDMSAAQSLPLSGANFAEWFKQTIEKRNGK